MLERDVNDNRKIGNYGAQHILSGVPRDSVTILTHCNTGSLATAGYGTALGKTTASSINNILFSSSGQLQSIKYTCKELSLSTLCNGHFFLFVFLLSTALLHLL